MTAPVSVSETELAVLKVLWDQPRTTVRDLMTTLKSQGRTWAYTTVQTLLSRLEAKACVGIDRTGGTHLYSASVTRDGFLRQRLDDLADSVCEGVSSPLMLALVEGRRFAPEEIEQFRKLIDRLESESADPAEGHP